MDKYVKNLDFCLDFVQYDEYEDNGKLCMWGTVGHDLFIWSKIDVHQLYSFCFILKLETILKKMSYHKAL